MAIITKANEEKKIFISLGESKEDGNLYFWKDKEIFSIDGETVKQIKNIQLLSIGYIHIDKKLTSNPKYGDINTISFKFRDLDSNEIIYLQVRAGNSTCNTILISLLSDNFDILKPIDISINHERKSCKIFQDGEMISWKYNTEDIINKREQLGAVRTSLFFLIELVEKNNIEFNFFNNKQKVKENILDLLKQKLNG